MEIIKEEILTFLSKIWAWLLYIGIGMIGKFSYDIITGKKITWAQAFASTGIALFVGFLSGLICVYNDWEKQQMIVIPISTLLSEKLMLAVFSVNYKKLISDILNSWSKKLKD